MSEERSAASLIGGPDDDEIRFRVKVIAGVGTLSTALLTGVAVTRREALPTEVLFPVAIAVLGLAVTAALITLLMMTARSRRRAVTRTDEVLAHLRARERELVQSNRELERFASIAAHDLQEPLRTVLTFSDLIERRHAQDMSPEALGYNLRIATAAARMRNLVEDLLVYARIGQEERTYETVDLHEAAEEALANLEQLIGETGATITLGELPRVLGNRPGLVQVLTNLVANACKYTIGEPPVVEIFSEKGDGVWIVAVRDNGKGIDPSYHERIFELFRRLETRNRGGGTGLGLAICKRVVELHGGRIWVRSQLGHGSTFFFTIPAMPGLDRARGS